MRIIQTLVGLCLPSFVWAASGAPQWSMLTSLARSNSLYVANDGNESSSWDLTLAPSLKLNKDYSVSALLTASQDLKTEDSDYGQAKFAVSKYSGYWGFHKKLKIVPRVSVGLPASQAAKAASLIASPGMGSRFELNPDYLFSKKFGVALDLSFTRNLHQYETAINGAINTQYSSAQSLELSWSFNDRIGVTGSVGHYNTWSYQGVARDYLSHNEELGFTASRHLSFAVGHAWGNPYVSTLRANGQDLNLEMTDTTNSLVYAQVSFVL